MSKKKQSKKVLNTYGETTGKKKKRLFLAEEVCYGLCIGIQLGFDWKTMVMDVHDDLVKWSKYTLPEESSDS